MIRILVQYERKESWNGLKEGSDDTDWTVSNRLLVVRGPATGKSSREFKRFVYVHSVEWRYCFMCWQEIPPSKDVIDLFLFSKGCSASLVDIRKAMPLPRQLQLMLENQHVDHVFAVSLLIYYYTLKQPLCTTTVTLSSFGSSKDYYFLKRHLYTTTVTLSSLGWAKDQWCYNRLQTTACWCPMSTGMVPNVYWN